MNQEWQMPRRGEQCCVCGAPFEPGAELTAVLFESAEGYARRDSCLRCEIPNEPKPLAQWRTRRPLPTTQKIAPFDRETVLAFFRRLEKAETPEQIQFRFVLALLLWRKKALKLADTITEDDREIWRFTQAQTQDAHNVVRPDLDEEQMERLSRQLEQLLAGQSGELEAIVSPAGPEAIE